MALRVFKILFDPKCRSILPDEDDFYTEIRDQFACRRMEEAWKARTFYLGDPLDSIDSNFLYSSSFGYFGIDKNIYSSEFGDMLSRWGELLDAKVEGIGEIFLYNLLNCYNCLDKDRTVFRRAPRSDVNLGILKYSFKVNRIGESLFKLPEFPKSGIYTITGRGDDDEDFYLQYHKHGFSGLRFEQVWSDSDG